MQEAVSPNTQIPVRPSLKKRLQVIKSGSGTSYDGTIEQIIEMLKQPGEDDLAFGRRLYDTRLENEQS